MKLLSSLKLTLVGLAALGLGVLWGSAAAIAAPLFLLAANLAAAIVVNPAFRTQLPLLVFHLALAFLVALAAAGRLTYLKGRVELSTGETFSGALAHEEAGLLHRSRLGAISFTNEGFSISYSPGLNRNETRNRVSWAREERVIGDQQPLQLEGYRFYTSSNKGFAPILAWRAPDGAMHRGTIHLPSYPMYDYRQAQEFTPPAASESLWLMLEFDEVLIDPHQRSEFRLPREHSLVVRYGESRAVLKPGERLAVGGGELRYEGLTSWMGYNVFYDWTLPWMLAAALLATASMGWHYWRKFSLQAWDG
jgi:cytochrome c biogenesis protein